MMTNPLGLESGRVRLVDYDRHWPLLFDAEVERIMQACGVRPLKLEHVGSTAVPGLCAKPVLDILGGRPAETAARDYILPLLEAGYAYRGEQGVPGREFFRRGQPRAYHLHLVAQDGALWRRYLAFRDYLRTHPTIAHQYADLKRVLAARFPRDREAYIDGKGQFVLDVLRRATPGA